MVLWNPIISFIVINIFSSHKKSLSFRSSYIREKVDEIHIYKGLSWSVNIRQLQSSKLWFCLMSWWLRKVFGTILGKRVFVPRSFSFCLSEASDTESLVEMISFVSQSVLIVPFDMVAIILQLFWSFVSPFKPSDNALNAFFY